MSQNKLFDAELKILENDRVERVVIAAREEFIEQGIMNAKMRNIAKRAGVGEASLYRYFLDKNELAKTVAFYVWRQMFDIFKDNLQEAAKTAKDSLDKIRNFLHLFIILYKEHPSFLVFTEDFDGYMQYVINDEKTASFASMIDEIKQYFLSLLTDGIKEGIIREDLDVDHIYSFISQVMAATSQKLVSRIGYLHKEQEEYGVKCLNDLISMFIHYIEKE